MTTLFGSDVCLKNILNLVKGGKKGNLKQVVTFDKEITQELKDAANSNSVEVLLFHELIEAMKSDVETIEDLAFAEGDNKAALESIFTISYTSGTSGNSKGVMLTNANFLSAITNIMQMANIFKFNKDDVYISYLPLAHVFDRLGCHTVLSVGGQIGFFGGNVHKITEDLKVL